MMLDTAVIPCGGLGTRLHPITRWLPKEMLPVGLKPVLYWTLDEAADAGLLRAIIITNPHKPMLEAVARSYQGPLELEFVPQDHPRGLGDAFLRARDNLGGSSFVALLPDNLFQGTNPTAALISTYRKTGLTTVLLAEIERKDAGSKAPPAGPPSARSRMAVFGSRLSLTKGATGSTPRVTRWRSRRSAEWPSRAMTSPSSTKWGVVSDLAWSSTMSLCFSALPAGERWPA